MHWRTMAVAGALLILSASTAGAQPATVNVALVGVSEPFGDAYSGVGTGSAVELSARYRIASWFLGAGLRGVSHGDTEIGRDVSVGTLFAELGYGERFTDASLKAGNRFYPYGAVRLGYTERERQVSEFFILVEDGLEVEPVVGFQHWFSHDVGADVSVGMPLAEFNDTFGGSAVFQAALVIGL